MCRNTATFYYFIRRELIPEVLGKFPNVNVQSFSSKYDIVVTQQVLHRHGIMVISYFADVVIIKKSTNENSVYVLGKNRYYASDIVYYTLQDVFDDFTIRGIIL